MKLALYKKNKTFTDKAISFWQTYNPVDLMSEDGISCLFSKYSHVEIVIGEEWLTSSSIDSGVRVKNIDPKHGHWDYLIIPTTILQDSLIKGFFREQYHKDYDYTGIFLSQVLPLDIQDPKQWFCSEICSQAMINAGLLKTDKHAQWYSPARLVEKMIKEHDLWIG